MGSAGGEASPLFSNGGWDVVWVRVEELIEKETSDTSEDD